MLFPEWFHWHDYRRYKKWLKVYIWLKTILFLTKTENKYMELYGQKNRSIPQKVIIHILEILFLLLSYWILFLKGGNFIQNYTGIHNAANGTGRRLIIFLFNIIIFFRLAFMMFYLLKRKIPWEESISVPFAFALYYIGFALFVLPVNRPNK